MEQTLILQIRFILPTVATVEVPVTTVQQILAMVQAVPLLHKMEEMLLYTAQAVEVQPLNLTPQITRQQVKEDREQTVQQK